ncbi:MAG: hypothetical protein HKM02_10080 [Pseudomonadales bacterium]|nr:hypothetical protein [Pseudomonadales bacterium]
MCRTRLCVSLVFCAVPLAHAGNWSGDLALDSEVGAYPDSQLWQGYQARSANINLAYLDRWRLDMGTRQTQVQGLNAEQVARPEDVWGAFLTTLPMDTWQRNLLLGGQVLQSHDPLEGNLNVQVQSLRIGQEDFAGKQQGTLQLSESTYSHQFKVRQADLTQSAQLGMLGVGWQAEVERSSLSGAKANYSGGLHMDLSLQVKPWWPRCIGMQAWAGIRQFAWDADNHLAMTVFDEQRGAALAYLGWQWHDHWHVYVSSGYVRAQTVTNGHNYGIRFIHSQLNYTW